MSTQNNTLSETTVVVNYIDISSAREVSPTGQPKRPTWSTDRPTKGRKPPTARLIAVLNELA